MQPTHWSGRPWDRDVQYFISESAPETFRREILDLLQTVREELAPFDFVLLDEQPVGTAALVFQNHSDTCGTDFVGMIPGTINNVWLVENRMDECGQHEMLHALGEL